MRVGWGAVAWLVSHPTFGKMVAVELSLSLLYAWYKGAMVVALTEVAPASMRASGFSLADSLATALGGSSLAISTWLIRETGDRASPGFWMSFAAVCGPTATVYVYAGRTRRAEGVLRAWGREKGAQTETRKGSRSSAPALDLDLATQLATGADPLARHDDRLGLSPSAGALAPRDG